MTRRWKAIVAVLGCAVWGTSPVAAVTAAPAPPADILELTTEIAKADQRLHDLDARTRSLREDVNRAVAEVVSARDAADTAQRQAAAAERELRDAHLALTTAGERFDRIAASTYVHGPASSLLLSPSGIQDVLDSVTHAEALRIAVVHVSTTLQRARTRESNNASMMRATRQRAEDLLEQAHARQATAQTALTDSERELAARRDEISELTAERENAVDELRRRSVTAAISSVLAVPLPDALITGDPALAVELALARSMESTGATSSMGRAFLAEQGVPDVADADLINGRLPRSVGPRAVEYVITRAMSQRGVPYSWGGGVATGPSHGIESGGTVVGFDCSGLIMYAFAGVGIGLPHYSGFQYGAGRQIPVSQMRRGDIVFYGPGGSQHVALYLGNRLMIESPSPGQTVRVAPLRTSGMTPYAVRLIES